MSDNSASVETYLPKISENLTLAELLRGYGNYWASLPSLSGYLRHYSISPSHHSTSPKNFLVWEGYPGYYDAYGDFEDDDAFYNESAKAYYLFWHLNHDRSQGRVDTWGDHDGKYASLAELRAAMINKWPKIQPTLGEQGARWHRFIREYRSGVSDLLVELARSWMAKSGSEAHYVVYTIENYVYLARWLGERYAVQAPPVYDYKVQGHPDITWEQVKSINIFRVALKRLPIRFSLEAPYQYKPERLTIQYSYMEEASSLKAFDQLRVMLKDNLPSLRVF